MDCKVLSSTNFYTSITPQTYVFKLCWYFSLKVYSLLLSNRDLDLMGDDLKLPMAYLSADKKEYERILTWSCSK